MSAKSRGSVNYKLRFENLEQHAGEKPPRNLVFFNRALKPSPARSQIFAGLAVLVQEVANCSSSRLQNGRYLHTPSSRYFTPTLQAKELGRSRSWCDCRLLRRLHRCYRSSLSIDLARHQQTQSRSLKRISGD